MVVDKTLEAFGKIDILVNNHAVQFVQKSILDITAEQLLNTFQTNIFSFFYLVKGVYRYFYTILISIFSEKGDLGECGSARTDLDPAYSGELSPKRCHTPIKRAGQPFELAPTYVYLASDDSRYVSGQVLHVNGGQMVES